MFGLTKPRGFLLDGTHVQFHRGFAFCNERRVVPMLPCAFFGTEGFPLFRLFDSSFLCFVQKVACTTFRMRVGRGWKEWFPPLSAVCGDFFSSQRRSSAGDVPLLARGHVACVTNPRKIKIGGVLQTQVRERSGLQKSLDWSQQQE